MLQLLIAPAELQLSDPVERIKPDFGKVRPVEPPQREDLKPEEFIPVPEPLTIIDTDYDYDNVINPVDLTPNPGDETKVGDDTGISFVVDGEYIPIVRAAPQFPIQAIERGLEGYVVVEFTVTPNGSTTNVVVVESSDRVFERNAIRAVERFKYQPKIVDGEPVSVPGVITRLDFILDEG